MDSTGQFANIEQTIAIAVILLSLALLLLGLFAAIIAKVSAFIAHRREKSASIRQAEYRAYILSSLRVRNIAKTAPLDLRSRREWQDLMAVFLYLTRNLAGNQRREILELMQDWGIFAHASEMRKARRARDRLRAIKIVALEPTHNYWPVLKALIKDADPRIRRASLAGIGEIVSRERNAALLEVFPMLDDDLLRIFPQVYAPFGLENTREILTLFEAPLRAAQEHALVKVISHSPAANVQSVLLKASESPHKQIRIEALRALTKQRERQAEARIMALLNDPQREVQIAAVQATGTLRIRGAIPRLVEIFRQDHGHLKEQAGAALVALGIQERWVESLLQDTRSDAHDQSLPQLSPQTNFAA